MKKIIIICLMGLLLAVSNTAMAYVTIDPDAGWTGDFGWTGGLGQIDYIVGAVTENTWDLTLAKDGWIDLAAVDNDYVGGDEFALYVDGSLVAWDDAYYVGPIDHPYMPELYPDQYFYHGEVCDLFLTAGTHTITLYVTQLALDYEGNPFYTGAAHAAFSGVTYVPAPGAILLGSIGVGLVGWLRRKRAL